MDICHHFVLSSVCDTSWKWKQCSGFWSVSTDLCDKFLNIPTHPPSFLTYKVATIVSVISLAIIVWVVGSHTFIECLLGAMQLETVYLVGQKNELSQNT